MAWLFFILLILALLFIDLKLVHKEDHEISMKESLTWTMVWVAIALLFSIAVYYIYEHNFYNINTHNLKPGEAVLDYITGFLIEKSLSLDNIFVIAIIFSYFKIEKKYQHNILFWGIIGALVFRGVMILLGAAFIDRLSWSTYILGAILIYSAVQMLRVKHEDTEYGNNPLLKLIEKIWPVKWEVRNSSYFIKENGKTFITVSFATLLVIEFTDVLFAVDSIPAILAVTTDPFIVFTSNIFAILGLRNLYFFLVSIMDRFGYIKYSLVFILAFVGVKMMMVHYYKLPSWISLVTIILALAVGIFASMIMTKQELKKNA
jgi:tellurite resistance protein TerC